MIEKQLKNWIKPVRRKLHLENSINRALNIVFIGSIVILLFSLTSFFYPIPFIEKYLLIIGLASIILSIIIGAFSYPDIQTSLKKVDTLGFKERFITAWEFKNDPSIEAQLQRTELEEHIKVKNLKKLYKPNIQSKKLAKITIILIIAIGILFIPVPAKIEAEKTEIFKKELEKQVSEIKEEKEKLYEKLNISEKDKEKIDEQLDQLMKQLEKSKTEDEALKNLAIAKNEMKKLDFEGILNGKKELDKLEELLNQATNEELKELLEDLIEAIKKQDTETNENSNESSNESTAEINEIIDNIINNSQTASNMTSFSKGMQSKISKIGQNMSQGTSISELAFQNTSQDPNNQNTGDQEGQQGQQGQGDQEGQGDGQGGQQGQGQGEGQGQGQGQGEGQGQGQGEGQGQGSGAGKGSTNQDEGYGNESSGTSHNQGGEKKEGEYEALYQPNRLGGSNEPSFVKGQGNKGGQSSYQEVEGMPIEKGNLVSYTEISGTYKQQASQAMNNMSIPYVMKDLIKDYFSSIN